MLTHAPVLIQPESRKDYVVYSDASHTSLGCVLMQDNEANSNVSLVPRVKQIEKGKITDFGFNSDDIPHWKWEQVIMDFVSKDSVLAHFLPVRTNCSLQKLARLYISEIVRLYMSKLVIQNLEDMQWGCIIDFRGIVVEESSESWSEGKFDPKSNPSHVVPIEEIKVRPDLSFEEESVQILDREVKVLRKNKIPLVNFKDEIIFKVDHTRSDLIYTADSGGVVLELRDP
ncbi:serine/threonine-protein phosphatase 6 regulatory ankyrin repeat subunit C-like [Gossypium australe]|uniref:Serine/threonine-protein phosphatase 6 regulatory ankyrin repeat subunit C-like n=1 Tax=Gossypium australe TaxID=47621 RepID=A0A5B6WH71_9ROSI|nr:serine/threonine-protein phosphatase 6 regulatory ankyrin repeat subunit C-like [Gossypium australe]